MSTLPPPSSESAARVGLGYGIAIAVSILVLISTIMLASYACTRVKSGEDETARSRRRSRSDLRPERIPTRDQESVMVVVVGIDKTVVESYPKMVLGRSKRLPKPNDDQVCCICLCEYEQSDTIRLVPECNHCFHAQCVDGWLKVSGTCPTCRNSPAPSAAATPLSESAPLAMHPR
ncbi:unnamed protein product [Rhodiola kirilowii]